MNPSGYFPKIFLIFLLISLATPLLFANDPLTLYEAVEKGRVKMEVRGNGGYNGECLSLSITNVSRQPLVVKVEAGTRFQSESDWMQDLMVTQEALFALQPLRQSRFGLFTMCTQHSNASPRDGEVFHLTAAAEGHLLVLAQTIDKYGYQNSTAQSAVWATIDQTPCNHIYGKDVEMVKRLRGIVSEATGQPCEMENLQPREHSITSINTSMDHLLPNEVQGASLTLYGENGAVVKQYFQDQALKPGFYHFKVGVHHTFGDSAGFALRLEAAGEILAQKTVSTADTIARLATLPNDIFANFEVKRPTKARVGIYDASGDLYILLADDHPLPAGMNRATFKGGRDLPPGKPYFLQVWEGDNMLISQALPLEVAGNEPTFAPLVKRGVFRATLQAPVQQARMEVVDAQGQVIWVVFDKSSLGPGAKNIPFVFQHTQGSNATFSVRLLDGEGGLLKEMAVMGK